MDQEKDEILHDFAPLLRIYKSGQIERILGTSIVPAGTDPITGVISKDITIDHNTGLSARLYIPPNLTSSESEKIPVLVYFHGGGFMIETAASPTYHKYLNSLVSKANIIAVSAEYRRAPEYRLPIAYDDCWAVLMWVLDRCDSWISDHADLTRCYLGGDSAGGNIAHYLVLKAASEAIKIRGMLLCHPWFMGSEPVGTEPFNKEMTEKVAHMWKFICPETEGLDDPRMNPFITKEAMEGVFKCEKVMVAVAEKDGLCVRGKAYYEKLKEREREGWAGEIEFYEAKGEDHVYYLHNPSCEKAEEMMDRVVKFLSN